VQPQVIQFTNKFSQSQPIYKAFKALHESDAWSSLEAAQQRIVKAAIRDAELSGVGLEGEKRERFNAIQLELAELSTKFSNHVLDATKAFSMTLTHKDEVDGLPPSLTSLAAQAARAAGEEGATAENGPWRITLDYPSYVPFMQHSTRRDLREKLYKAFISRASTGELDNTPLIERILELRKEKAMRGLLTSYAELSLQVDWLLMLSVEAAGGLRRAVTIAAHKELEELKAFASAKAGRGKRMTYDTGILAFGQSVNGKKNLPLVQKSCALTSPCLRYWMAISLVNRLFGVTVTAGRRYGSRVA
jgi:oligopeptidase A